MIKITKTNRSIIRRLGSDSRGAAAIEYGLLAALVSTAFIMGAVSLGTSINGVNEVSSSQIDNVVAAMTGSNPAAENNDKGSGGKGDKGGKGGKGKKGNKGNHGIGNNGNGNGNGGGG